MTTVCTVDGAQFAHGDAGLPFTLQQCSYPINFALCADEIGLAKVLTLRALFLSRPSAPQLTGRHDTQHDTQVGKVVGYEGVGGGDAFTLNADKKPHNPITLAGALAVCGALTSASYASAPTPPLPPSCPTSSPGLSRFCSAAGRLRTRRRGWPGAWRATRP
jgi:hypothetical protein